MTFELLADARTELDGAASLLTDVLGAVPPAPTFKRLESVWIGKDNALLDAMFEFYAPSAKRVIDVCCNARRMWKGSATGAKVAYYDRDPAMQPDVVAHWHDMPDADGTVDVLVYDPPHLPDAAASPQSLARYGKDYGLGKGVKADNVSELHAPFLAEAKRVLKHDGLVFAKIKDYVHNHKYQWNLELFNAAVREAGLMPCDLIIKRDPCGGNLKSGRWQRAHHAKNTHCFWVVVRNSKRCEPKAPNVERWSKTMTELEQAMKWAEDQKGKFKSHGIVLAEEIQRLRTELEMSDRCGNVLSEIVSNHCIAMQSAWIDSELVSPEQGMKWIFNTLLGPGLLPNLDAAREGGGAQAWFDRESAEDEARRAKEKEAAK